MTDYSPRALRSVLRSRALAVCAGAHDRADMLGRLAELVNIAAALSLDEDAARLSKLLDIANRGGVDLERAALACLLEIEN